ncbi:MAG TPA: ABC transporter substrate-binding protein, partial [Actinomycetota bacterium]
LAVAFIATGCSTLGDAALKVGAIYPLSGTQGPGGIAEYRGTSLAIDLINDAGGVNGRAIELVPLDVPDSDAVPSAIEKLDDEGVDVVLGSYGSTISAPAAAQTAARGMLFWESGAVGTFDPAAMNASSEQPGALAFRFAPTGVVLGRAAIQFVANRLAGKLDVAADELRFGVASVDDVYGETVRRGAVEAIDELGLRLAGDWTYDPRGFDASQLARSIEKARTDVLFVVAYLEDGVALREAIVDEDVPLVASIGTSSSYCHPEFGARLGRRAVGLYASDKPDAGALNPEGLAPEARALLERARTAYEDRYDEEMDASALSGFSAAWALLDGVLPNASSDDARGIADAARRTQIPAGSLPNGSGLMFGRAGSPDQSNNLRAESVIWEWVDVRRRAIVWPPRYRTSPIRPMAIAH